MESAKLKHYSPLYIKKTPVARLEEEVLLAQSQLLHHITEEPDLKSNCAPNSNVTHLVLIFYPPDVLSRQTLTQGVCRSSLDFPGIIRPAATSSAIFRMVRSVAVLLGRVRLGPLG